jgi:hypothetical protein
MGPFLESPRASQLLRGGQVPHARAIGHNPFVTADIHRLHQAFEDAELRADTDTLQALLADDFRSIGDQGYVLDKAQ